MLPLLSNRDNVIFNHNLTRPEAQQRFLDAHAYLPARAEPLYHVARYWLRERKNYALAFLFALRGSRIPFPADLRLFIDKQVIIPRNNSSLLFLPLSTHVCAWM